MSSSPSEIERELARLEKLARWLDAEYATPFGIRVGWDGILGLIPILGEIVTTAISAYLIARAAVLGASAAVLLRMGLNVVADDLIALVPFLGWIGDFLWKSNLKNTDLLRRHLADPAETRRRSAMLVGGIVAGVAVLATAFSLLVGIAAWRMGAFLYAGFLSGAN